MCTRLTNENVQTRVEVGESVPGSVLTDVEWVWQILMNLVTNAAKYTYKGRVEVFMGYRDEELELHVQDTGIGMDDKQKEAVFDKFFTHQKYSHGSHGVGLYSVKAKVDILGGSCTISDNPGGGSIFVVCQRTRLFKTREALNAATPKAGDGGTESGASGVLVRPLSDQNRTRGAPHSILQRSLLRLAVGRGGQRCVSFSAGWKQRK